MEVLRHQVISMKIDLLKDKASCGYLKPSLKGWPHNVKASFSIIFVGNLFKQGGFHKFQTSLIHGAKPRGARLILPPCILWLQRV